MKKICKLLGNVLLGITSVIITIGPASMSTIAAEEMPKYMKSKR